VEVGPNADGAYPTRSFPLGHVGGICRISLRE